MIHTIYMYIQKAHIKTKNFLNVKLLYIFTFTCDDNKHIGTKLFIFQFEDTKPN